jgi:hypothetical protein
MAVSLSVHDVEPFSAPPFSESEIKFEVVIPCGGRSIKEDATRASEENADFLIGGSVIELKLLDADPISTPGSQEMMAELFGGIDPGCPTVVIDRSLLDEVGKSNYDNALRKSIKAVVKKAKRQLRNSLEETGAQRMVLWIVNNSCSSLDHEAVLRIATKCVKNDKGGKERGLDALIVSGHYFLSDGFDHLAVYPIDHVLFEEGRSLEEFDTLKKAWDMAVERRTTRIIRGDLTIDSDDARKLPIADQKFVLNGVTYVKPAPRMMGSSAFWGPIRPRKPFVPGDDFGPQCIIHAGIAEAEWGQFTKHKPALFPHANFEEWRSSESAAKAHKGRLPSIVVPVTYAGWSAWLGSADDKEDGSVHSYANRVFHQKAEGVFEGAIELKDQQVLPDKFMYLVTRQIGQDASLDVSYLFEVSFFGTPKQSIIDVWVNRRLDLQSGKLLASAQAVIRGVDSLYWSTDNTYCWF